MLLVYMYMYRVTCILYILYIYTNYLLLYVYIYQEFPRHEKKPLLATYTYVHDVLPTPG